MYRSIEVQTVVGHETFGEMKASEVTRQLAYALYEQNVLLRGHDSANKAMSAWVAAFRYGLLKLPEITSNPFSDLDKLSSVPRRQRWTDQLLDSFIKKAEELGYQSVGRCALLCMEPDAAAGRYSEPEMGCLRGRRKNLANTADQTWCSGTDSRNAPIAHVPNGGSNGSKA